MTSGGVQDTQMMTIWKCYIPLKVKIFMWMAAHDRIQCGVQLKKKKWLGLKQVLSVINTKLLTTFCSNVPYGFSLDLLTGVPGLVCDTNSCTSLFLEIVEKCRGKKQHVTVFYAQVRCRLYGRRAMTWCLTRRR